MRWGRKENFELTLLRNQGFCEGSSSRITNHIDMIVAQGESYTTDFYFMELEYMKGNYSKCPILEAEQSSWLV